MNYQNADIVHVSGELVIGKYFPHLNAREISQQIWETQKIMLSTSPSDN